MPYYPNYYNPYYQQQMQMQAQNAQNQQQTTPTPTIQQSGFVLVRSEQEARSYPVAPGNSVTFKAENAPFVYVKTMGFNQFDQPLFDKYRLVREEAASTQENAQRSEDDTKTNNHTEYALKSDLSALWHEFEELKDKLKSTEKKSAKSKKIEDDDDDE